MRFKTGSSSPQHRVGLGATIHLGTSVGTSNYRALSTREPGAPKNWWRTSLRAHGGAAVPSTASIQPSCFGRWSFSFYPEKIQLLASQKTLVFFVFDLPTRMAQYSLSSRGSHADVLTEHQRARLDSAVRNAWSSMAGREAHQSVLL